MPEPLPSDLATALAATVERRGVYGRTAFYLSETSSTNDEAGRLAEAGAPEGTVVIAAAQTAGRGRLGRGWYSPPDAGLYASIVCRERRAAPFLTLAGGVAVAEGIRAATALPVEIKWPNDVVVTDRSRGCLRKLAGVLAEASAGAGELHHIILGIGINLRRTAYPAAIAEKASSLEAESGRPVERGVVLAEILASFCSHATRLARGESAVLLRRWRELSPSAAGARVEFDGPSGREVGTTVGIADDGALLVRAGERINRVVAGELSWR